MVRDFWPGLTSSPFWSNDPGDAPLPALAAFLERHHSTIASEFAVAKLTDPKFGGTVKIRTGDNQLIAVDPSGDEPGERNLEHWSRLRLFARKIDESEREGPGGRKAEPGWQSEGCRVLPSACRLLKAEKAVVGKITAAAVSAANATTWLPRNGAEGGPPSPWNRTEIVAAGGAVPDSVAGDEVPGIEISVLRLAPGGRLIRHNGISNRRLTVQLPLELPEDPTCCAIRVGEVQRSWVFGKVR